MKKTIKDIAGNVLKIGDTVRVIGVPDLSGMVPECRAESEPVFRSLVGKYRKIKAFDSTGGVEPWAEIEFRIKTDGEWHTHWVYLEPTLLRKKQSQ
jgi:hypothetical protein